MSTTNQTTSRAQRRQAIQARMLSNRNWLGKPQGQLEPRHIL
jgi:hypothetical protein